MMMRWYVGKIDFNMVVRFHKWMEGQTGDVFKCFVLGQTMDE